MLQLEPAATPAAADGPTGSITAATRERLEAVERLGTPEAAVVLHLARLIDGGDYNAQGAAALAKSWHEALTRATRGAQDEPDLVDELRARRRARLAAAQPG